MGHAVTNITYLSCPAKGCGAWQGREQRAREGRGEGRGDEPMHPQREALLTSARAAHGLLAAPETASRWTGPSALEGFSVGGLAAHINTILGTCRRGIGDPDTDEEPMPAEAFYTTFVITGSKDESNAAIVAHGEDRARHGPEATAARFADQLTLLEGELAEVPEGRVVRIFGLAPIGLDDFFLTRVVEFIVHSDDLAVSLGLPTPDLDPGCWELLMNHLLATARHRHGDLAVLRAMARRERDDVEALRVL